MMKVSEERKQPRLWYRVVNKLARDDGQSLVLVALSTLVLLGMAGVGVSVGTVDYARSQLQNAVDAAALAGAQADTYGLSPSSENVLISKNDPGAQGTVNPESPNYWLVDAVGTKVISGGFASLFGFQTFTIRAKGVAEEYASPFDYAVFQGSSDPNTPLSLNGSVSVQTVTQPSGTNYPSNVFSNGDLSLTGGGITIDGEAEAGGTVSESGNPTVTGSPPIVNNEPNVAMPNWTVPQLPNPSTGCSETSIGSPACSSASLVVLNVPAGQTVTLSGAINSSVMVVGGGSISLGSNTTVNGSLYTSGGGSITVTGNTDTVTGDILAENNTSSPATASAITIGSATVGGTVVAQGGNVVLEGNATSGSGTTVSVATLRENGVGGDITVHGGVTLIGVLYAPNGNVILGKGGGGNVSITGSVVGNTDTLSGNVTISYNPNDVAKSAFQHVALVQ